MHNYLRDGTLYKCPICNGTEFVPYKNGTYGKYVYSCINCNLVFTNPQPDEQKLLKKYDTDYYAGWITPAQRKRRLKLWKNRLIVVQKIIPSGKLLDVGCGEGLFLHCAKNVGYEVSGVEVSGFAVRYAKSNFGLEIINSTLEDSGLAENSFDVITFWHTLEHLPNPETTLKKAYQLLKPDGFLITAVPNLHDKIGREFYRFINKHYFELYTPESKEPHLYHFSQNTLRHLLEKNNFKVIRMGADFCQVDPYWKVVEKISYCVSKMSGKNWCNAILAVAKKSG